MARVLVGKSGSIRDHWHQKTGIISHFFVYFVEDSES